MKSLLALLAACLLATAVQARQLDAGAVVLVNSKAPDYADFRDLLEPYLVHFGVPYAVRDISQAGAFRELDRHGVVIIGHRGLDAPRRFITAESETALQAAIHSGTGLVSFDGLLSTKQRGGGDKSIYSYPAALFDLQAGPSVEAAEISIGGDAPHYIVSQGKLPRTVKLKVAVKVPGLVAGSRTVVLARAGEAPLLVAAEAGAGRAVLFATYDWTRPSIKGKLYGLDDLVWRSIVWAARKPFVIRGMPKYLAMRVDDVSGFGLGANQHLGWIDAANRHGLKPWVGVFIDDLREDPEAVRRLADMTQKGLATASVHARRWPEFFYLDEPLATDSAQRNIAGKPWPDGKMAANWAEAEKFFAANGIVKSKLVLPHFYQFAPNNFEGLKRWGAEMVGTVLVPGHGYGTEVPKSGPFLPGEPSRVSSAKDPILIADWLTIPGQPQYDRQFFNFILEIRDVTGYEWAPSGVSVEEAIRRGVEESRREFDSLLPAVLFTHESDHIRHIQPQDWEAILAGVMARLKSEDPLPVTLDFVTQYMRALKTSSLRGVRYDSQSGEGIAELSGTSDLPVKLMLFRDGDERPQELEAPAFRDRVELKWKAAIEIGRTAPPGVAR